VKFANGDKPQAFTSSILSLHGSQKVK